MDARTCRAGEKVVWRNNLHGSTLVSDPPEVASLPSVEWTSERATNVTDMGVTICHVPFLWPHGVPDLDTGDGRWWPVPPVIPDSPPNLILGCSPFRPIPELAKTKPQQYTLWDSDVPPGSARSSRGRPALIEDAWPPCLHVHSWTCLTLSLYFHISRMCLVSPSATPHPQCLLNHLPPEYVQDIASMYLMVLDHTCIPNPTTHVPSGLYTRLGLTYKPQPQAALLG